MSNNIDSDESDDNQPQIPYRRDRTPSIVVQSLGLSFHKDSNINESIELAADEEDSSQNSNSSGTTDQKSSISAIDDPHNAVICDSSGGSAKGSLSSLQNSSPGVTSPVRACLKSSASKITPAMYGNNRRFSLNIGSTAPRRQSLTVDGLASYVNPAAKDPNAPSTYLGGSATGSLRNKVALKPGHSLMGWIRLASTAKDLSGTQGKIIEVTPEELAKHDKEDDCWVALKGNVYNVTTYLQYHPGGVEELMRGAGRDATELFNEVHRWVNYESILAKCLVGPYKLESPLTPTGRVNFATISGPSSPTSKTSSTSKRDPTIVQKPPRRQSIALTVPSPNKYQSLLLSNNSSTNQHQIQQPPTYMFVQDKTSVKLKILDLTTLPQIRSRHLIGDLNDSMELHLSVILSPDWLYRVHLRLDQPVEELMSAEFSSECGTITIQLNKKEAGIWNRMGTALDLNDSLCETTLADKFFRSCQLVQKDQLTHDTYLFQFKLKSTLMYIPIGWHVLIREHQLKKAVNGNKNETSKDNFDDYRVHKNYTAVLPSILDNNGLADESGFMDRLCFIIKIYPNGVVTSKLNQLHIGDSVDISDYQSVDFNVEVRAMNPKHWVLLAAGTGITPFCRTISYLLSQNEETVKSVTLMFFNKTQKDIILHDQFKQLSAKNELRFKVIHVLSNEQDDGSATGYTKWKGKTGKVNKELVAEAVDSISPDELELLTCGPRAFTQLVKSIAIELNLQEKLYIFHG